MLYTTKTTKIFAQVNIADYRYMGFLLAYKENKCLKGQASAAEVAVAEAAWGITLPLALKEQMMILGIGMAFFIVAASEYDVRNNEFAEMQAAAKEMAEEDGVLFMQDGKALVLACMPGERCWFLRTDEGEDPPVYYYESGRQLVRKADSFSAFIQRFSPYYTAYRTPDYTAWRAPE